MYMYNIEVVDFYKNLYYHNKRWKDELYREFFRHTYLVHLKGPIHNAKKEYLSFIILVEGNERTVLVDISIPIAKSTHELHSSEKYDSGIEDYGLEEHVDFSSYWYLVLSLVLWVPLSCIEDCMWTCFLWIFLPS